MGLVLDVDWSPDGKLLLSASADQTLRVWSAETGREEAVLEGHTSAVTAAAFSDDGRIIASSGSFVAATASLPVGCPG